MQMGPVPARGLLCVGCMQELDTNVPHFTGAQLGQRVEHIRRQGTKGLVLRASGNKNDDG